MCTGLLATVFTVTPATGTGTDAMASVVCWRHHKLTSVVLAGIQASFQGGLK